MLMNEQLVNPQALDALLRVLRAHDVSGFEQTLENGSRIILQLAPRLQDAVGRPGIEVFDDRGAGGWK